MGKCKRWKWVAKEERLLKELKKVQDNIKCLENENEDLKNIW